MAKLVCSDDNKDPSSEVSFSLNLGEKFHGKNFKDESINELWQRFSLEFKSGLKTVSFNTDAKEASEVKGLFCLNLSPTNEIKQLRENIEKFLDDDSQDKLVFETIEPSFELVIEKAHAGAFKVYAWVDAGNTSTIIYTWDALGLRFMTDRNKIEMFISELSCQIEDQL
ncbi:MAG: hypothetical protein HRT47_03895 [Candidatus Caenarcaniphilales bacterium]|nr:hypothetical protein [Candidatus Caenarcaniphilales bacterium]